MARHPYHGVGRSDIVVTSLRKSKSECRKQHVVHHVLYIHVIFRTVIDSLILALGLRMLADTRIMVISCESAGG
jgi:hypothetical protein